MSVAYYRPEVGKSPYSFLSEPDRGAVHQDALEVGAQGSS